MSKKLTNEEQLVLYYRKNPVAFLTECLDVKKHHVWSKMEEICKSVADNQFTCVKAGNSLSKSYTVGRLALWFLYTHNPSTVFTTAPSNIQVEEIIWREIRDAHRNAKVPLGGTMLKTKLELAEKWFATGFATKADAGEDEATRVLGIHNEDMLIILDEAPGVADPIWAAIDRLITNPRVKILVIGNPIYASGQFVDCFKDPKFNKITVSVFDSPNYIQNKEVVPGLAGRSFVEYVKNKFGEGTNQWKSMITGEIPSSDVDSLIPYSAIESAFSRTEIKKKFRDILRFIVWDVADGGSDKHTIKCWENMTVIDELVLHDKTIEEAEPYVWRMLRKNDANAIVWDNDGRGRVAGGYLELSCDKNTQLYPFDGSSRDVEDSALFYNVRDEAHWVMRDTFIEGSIKLNKNEELMQELCSAKEDISSEKSINKQKYISVESKKKEKKRLGRSPDERDNVMMACYAHRYFDIEPVKRYDAYDRPDKSEAYCFNPQTC